MGCPNRRAMRALLAWRRGYQTGSTEPGSSAATNLERPAAWLDWSQVTFVEPSHRPRPQPRTSPLHIGDRRCWSLMATAARLPRARTISRSRPSRSGGVRRPVALHQPTPDTDYRRKSSTPGATCARTRSGGSIRSSPRPLDSVRTGQGKAMGLAAYGTPALLRPLSEFVENPL